MSVETRTKLPRAWIGLCQPTEMPRRELVSLRDAFKNARAREAVMEIFFRAQDGKWPAKFFSYRVPDFF